MRKNCEKKTADFKVLNEHSACLQKKKVSSKNFKLILILQVLSVTHRA